MRGRQDNFETNPLAGRALTRRPFWFLIPALVGVFVAGGLFSALVFLTKVVVYLQPVVPTGVITRQAVVAPETRPAGIAPIVAGQEPLPDPPQGGRVNILLLGIDERPDERGQPTRTDTMILASLDPVSRSAALLSLPRDLWVPIPMKDRPLTDRINTAHFYGEWFKYPGGGPELAKQTVQYNLGVPVHHYARVNFTGFERIVDVLGGIDVDIPSAIRDDEYPTDDYGVMRVYFPAGRQHLNGSRALQYARTRHVDSDFGRMKRQQQVLLAIRERALQVNVLPRLPGLIQEFRNAVSTDIPVTEMLALARLGWEVDRNKVAARTLEAPAVTSMLTSQGADILVPNRREMEKVVAELFFDARLREEAARVEVLNSAGVPGLAARAVALFERRGIKKAVAGNSTDGRARRETEIYVHNGKTYSAGVIADWLGIPRSRVQLVKESSSNADIRIILGQNTRVPD